MKKSVIFNITLLVLLSCFFAEAARERTRTSGKSPTPELVQAVVNGEAEKVSEILSQNEINVNGKVRDRLGFETHEYVRLLHLAGNKETVDALSKAGADPNAKDHLGRNPLFGNPMSGGWVRPWVDHDLEVMKALETIGTDINSRESKSYRSGLPSGANLLHKEAYRRDSDSLARTQFLIDSGIDLNLPAYSSKRTPSHLMASRGRIDKLRLMGEAGGVDFDKPDADGNRPVHLAMNLETAEFLVKELGADPNARDNRGRLAPYVQDFPHIFMLSQGLSKEEAQNEKASCEYKAYAKMKYPQCSQTSLCDQARLCIGTVECRFKLDDSDLTRLKVYQVSCASRKGECPSAIDCALDQLVVEDTVDINSIQETMTTIRNPGGRNYWEKRAQPPKYPRKGVR